MKPIFRLSSYLFGFFFMAILSASVVSSSDNLAEELNHVAVNPNNHGEFLSSAPVAANQQILLNGPTITIWYGSSQYFGFLGNPQPMINILGNVSDPDGIGSLEYSLNGGAWHDLSWKETASLASPSMPQPRGLTDGVQIDAGTAVDGSRSVQSVIGASTNPRLVSEGDFNIEIYTVDLNNGANTVTVRAKDKATPQNTTSTPVTINYTGGQVWPMPYTADWSNGPTSVAQVVDGKWNVVGGRLRPVVTGYDRVIAIGDLLAWDDFEVRVPITIHALPVQNSGGVGIVARWQGHFVTANEQPGIGWWHIGAYGYYRNRDCPPCPHFAFRTSADEPLQETATLKLGVPYNFKMRAQTKGCGGDGLYSFKVWESGKTEPSAWIFEECDDPSNAYDNGSVLLVAHNIDASFGDVTILPVLDVNVNTSGNGMVDVDPSLNGMSDAYLHGDSITLTATADPGWIFSGWSGDLSGNTNPLTLILNEDLNATANFVRAYSLSLNVVGNGEVVADPPGPQYAEGTTITLTAAADPGWKFKGWSGDLNGSANPTTLIMNSNKAVTATFEKAFTLDINLSGNGNVTVEPDQPFYTNGQVVTLTATADPDWRFTGWSGDLSGNTNPATLTMNSDKAVTAVFERVFTLEISLSGNGSVAVEPDQPVYTIGQVVTLTATADPGWTFTGWSGDLSGNANPETLSMDSDKLVQANFVKGVYSLTIVPSGNGTVTVDPNKPVYAPWEVITLTAEPAHDWIFLRWGGDLSATQNPISIAVSSHMSVTAYFGEYRNHIFVPLMIANDK